MTGIFRRLFTALLGFTLFIHTMAEERDRFWSGPPQAIGIDLSPSLIHAVLATPDGNFTHLATVSPDLAYRRLMGLSFLNWGLQNEKHTAAWNAHQRWATLRAVVIGVKEVVERYSWTRWAGNWLPDVVRDEDWRYTFDAALDHGDEMPMTRHFITTIADALQLLKAGVFETHNINITSAVVAKPEIIYNELDRLLEKACAQAGIEVLSLQDRIETAIAVARDKGGKNTLVLEQTVNTFRLHRSQFHEQGEGHSSVSHEHLSSAYIIGRLMDKVLNHLSLTDEQVNKCFTDVDGYPRLWKEVARTRYTMKLATPKNCEVGVEEDGRVVIYDWQEGVDVDVVLSSGDVNKVENGYVDAVRDAVEVFLKAEHSESLLVLRSTVPWKTHQLLMDHHANSRSGTADESDDTPDPSPDNFSDPLALDRDPVLTTPGLIELGSWWESVDTVLILADFPDARLVAEGVAKALSRDLRAADGVITWDGGVVARGAAREARSYWPGEVKDEEEWEYEDEEHGESDEEHDDL